MSKEYTPLTVDGIRNKIADAWGDEPDATQCWVRWDSQIGDTVYAHQCQLPAGHTNGHCWVENTPIGQVGIVKDA